MPVSPAPALAPGSALRGPSPFRPLLGPTAVQFLQHASEEARRQLPFFSCQGLSNTAWALTKLGPLQPSVAALLGAAADAAAPCLADFSNQELSMMLMAASSQPAGRSRALMEAAGQQLEARAATLSEWDLATILSGAAGRGGWGAESGSRQVKGRKFLATVDRMLSVAHVQRLAAQSSCRRVCS